jgi:hypothetical protein
MMAKQPNGWTPEEEALLVDNYGKATKEQLLALLPNRTMRAIRGRACLLGNLTQKLTPWTAEQTALMHKHYAELGADAMAKMLGRTPASVWHRAQDLKLVIRKRPAVPKGRAKTGPKPKPAKNITFARPVEKPLPVPFKDKEGVITADTKVTIAPPFVDRRWVVEVAPRVVDASQCRAWVTA